LITDELPQKISNSDPVTGQAGWYDVRVRIYAAQEEGVWPQFPVLGKVPA
jgi:hypothetical protein